MGGKQVEERLANLEMELARLRRIVEGSEQTKPWWERIADTFENDPIYEKAMKFGREYRRSLRPKAARGKKK